MRLFFHLVSAHEVILDHDGVEVADLDQARAQAMRAIEEFRHEHASAARDGSGWTLIVGDPSGAVLFSLHLDNIS